VAPQNGYAGNRTTGKFSAHLQLVRHVACRKIINTLIELLTDTHTVASKGGYRPRANAVHRSWVSRQEGGFGAEHPRLVDGNAFAFMARCPAGMQSPAATKSTEH